MSTSEDRQQSTKRKERWWKTADVTETKACGKEPREGNPCPSCLLGELYYNGLFQLICDNCGRVAEAAVFT